MEMRRRLARYKHNRRKGELRCCKCKTKGHFMLWEGGLCKRCYKPGAITFVPSIALGPYEKPPQSEETIELQSQCDALMSKHNLRRFRFAKNLGLVPSGFVAWHSGLCQTLGQARMNARVKDGIDRVFELTTEKNYV